MLVQRVLMPASSLESWTVLGDEGGPVEPIERYLAYLTDVERSPNTVKAYAHDLKDWFVFLDRRGLDWREVRLEDLGEFVAWLRLPPAGRTGTVALLPSAAARSSWRRPRASPMRMPLSQRSANKKRSRSRVQASRMVWTWTAVSNVGCVCGVRILIVRRRSGAPPARCCRNGFQAVRRPCTGCSSVTRSPRSTPCRAWKTYKPLTADSLRLTVLALQ